MMKKIICTVGMMAFVLVGHGCATTSDVDTSDDEKMDSDGQTSARASELGGVGSPCASDGECSTGVCNTFSHQCAFSGGSGVGTGCNRDFECSTGVCNTFAHQCAFKAGVGSGCIRDFECSTGVCNTFKHQCAFKGGVGSQCNRGFECFSGVCNGVTHLCQ
jgi:hypothetical protein